MTGWLASHYDWLRALHIISVIAWMAGMLYLPRLFVYHADAIAGSDKSETFKVMERKLMRIIMNPAMIAAWTFGLCLLAARPDLMQMGWMHVKLLGIVVMTGLHHVFARWMKKFARDENTRPAKFYRIWNEVPALVMVVIVIMAVAEPF